MSMIVSVNNKGYMKKVDENRSRLTEFQVQKLDSILMFGDPNVKSKINPICYGDEIYQQA